jgi:DNA polymerase
MASHIFSIPYEKVKKNSVEYFVGKTAILGLGYGMGAKKFRMTCENFGNPISADLAKRTVDTYRKYYWAVTQFWQSIETIAKVALKQKGETIPCSTCKIHWIYEGDVLKCKLPSGRRLYYHEPELQLMDTPYGEKLSLTYMGQNSVTRKWERETTWGGKLTENIDQAISRDLLANAMVNLRERKNDIVMTVHDEVVIEAKEDEADLQELNKTMCILPDWARGLPVKADGWMGKRFRKD